MKKTEKTGAVSELFGGKKKPGAGGVSGAAQALFSDSEARFGRCYFCITGQRVGGLPVLAVIKKVCSTRR